MAGSSFLWARFPCTDPPLLSQIGSVVTYLQKLSGMPIPPALPPATGKFTAWSSPNQQVYLTYSVYKVVSQKSIPVQIRQLILHYC